MRKEGRRWEARIASCDDSVRPFDFLICWHDLACAGSAQDSSFDKFCGKHKKRLGLSWGSWRKLKNSGHTARPVLMARQRRFFSDYKTYQSPSASDNLAGFLLTKLGHCCEPFWKLGAWCDYVASLLYRPLFKMRKNQDMSGCFVNASPWLVEKHTCNYNSHRFWSKCAQPRLPSRCLIKRGWIGHFQKLMAIHHGIPYRTWTCKWWTCLRFGCDPC